MTDQSPDITWEQRKDRALFALGYLTGAIGGKPEADLVAQSHAELMSFIAHAEWLVGEEELSIDARDRMADILTRTANVLKGDPTPLSSHSWHDLPESALLAMHPDMGRVRRAAAKLSLWWVAAEVERGQPFEDRYPILRHKGQSIEVDVFGAEVRELLDAIYGDFPRPTSLEATP